MLRRKLLAGACLGWGLAASSARANQDVLRLVVPYAAGGQMDGLARVIADALRDDFKAVVVENKPGAAGLIGTRDVLNTAAPSVLLNSQGLVSVPLLQSGAGYDPFKDFVPVSLVARSPSFLIVHESVPARTVEELIAYAKARPEGITAANNGINSAGHLHAAWFAKHANIHVVHVPYKGIAETANALASGQVQMQLTTTTESLNGFVKIGRVRILAIMSDQKDPVFAPGVPTLSETLPGVSSDTWFGLFAKTGTSPQIIQKTANAVRALASSPAMQEKFRPATVSLQSSTPEELARLMKRSSDRYVRIMSDLGIPRAV